MTEPTATSTSTADLLKPPVARRDDSLVVHVGVPPADWPHDVPRQAEGSTEALVDPPVAIPNPYGWLRDDKRLNEHVIAHLKAENEYTQQITSHLEPLRDSLYKELLASIQETDYTVPRPHGDYYRYSRTFEGKAYVTYCRAPRNQQHYQSDTGVLQIEWDGTAASPVLPGEEIVLDVNALADGQEYCVVSQLAISPSKQFVAFTVDFTGNEEYELHIHSVPDDGTVVFQDPTIKISSNISWGKDDSSLFYFTFDETKRPFKLWRKRFDPNSNYKSTMVDDELVQQEDDPQFWSGVGKTIDDKYLLVEHGSGETSEFWFLDLDQDAQQSNTTTNKNTTVLQCIAKRRYRVLYDVDYRNGYWWIHSKTGDETPNMRLFIAPAKAHCEQEWTLVMHPNNDKPLFDGGYERALDGISTFSTHVVVTGREGGIPRVWVLSMNDDNDNVDNPQPPKVTKFEALSFEEEAYDVGLSSHYEFNTTTIMVGYDSLVTPLTHFEISLTDLSKRTVVKQKRVPGYNKEEFGCDRYLVPSRDGKVQIPVLRVYRKDVMEQHLADGTPLPTHLYGYGAYGMCVEASFSSTCLPLLRRGMVYVMAQIRGGSELGRHWYEEPDGGKYLCKKNTFNDFVDVARDLIDNKKLTSPEKLSIEGRSAGGMLIGATINQAPELFKVAILGVPFVDVVCTMADSTIPLTINEWEEWGCVHEQKYFQYMMEYCPMQNIKEGAKYPSCLLTCGFNDSRVQYWEAVKFAATLRHKQSPESGPVCVKIEMSAGHFSASDRYKYLRELAFDYAFLLDQLGLVGGT